MCEGIVLIVDDDKLFIEQSRRRLSVRNMDVFLAASCADAMKKLAARDEIEVVILGVHIAGPNLIEILQIIKRQYPLIEIIMLTDHATLEKAIEGMRLGASDYVLKSLNDDVFVEKIKEAVRKKRRQEEKIIDARAHEITSRRV